MKNLDDEGDAIVIEELELAVKIGVPEAERAKPQRLTITVTMWPTNRFDDLQDEIDGAVNYAEVVKFVEELAATRAEKLIETFANKIATELLQTFPLRKVRVELKKFILPNVKHVAVMLTRVQTSAA